MLVLDFLFNICYAPFRNATKGGRIGALLILTPSLTFVVFGGINYIFYLLVDPITQRFSPLVLALGMLIIFYLVNYYLRIVYLRNNRKVYSMSNPTIYILMLPIFFIGSIIIFGYTVDTFG